MKRVSVALLAALLLSVPAQARAFKQTLSCDESGQYACRAGETPKPVRWPNRCVSYYINELGTADIEDDSRTFAAVQRGFTTWSEVQGGEFAMEYAGLTNAVRVGKPPDGANIVVWRDDDWPYTSSKTAFAITSVTFDPSTGLIADADIEINSQFHQFTASDTGVQVDLSNTVTHEAGHFFGLDHSSVAEATMYGRAPVGEVDKRTLHADDIAGLMAIYPSVGITPECEDLPDYFDAPAVKKDKGCCATAAAPTRSGELALLIGSALVLRRRRKSKKVVEP